MGLQRVRELWHFRRDRIQDRGLGFGLRKSGLRTIRPALDLWRVPRGTRVGIRRGTLPKTENVPHGTLFLISQIGTDTGMEQGRTEPLSGSLNHRIEKKNCRSFPLLRCFDPVSDRTGRARGSHCPSEGCPAFTKCAQGTFPQVGGFLHRRFALSLVLGSRYS